jgi:hypothetical protein
VESFLNEVTAYLNAGILTQALADALTAAGNILLQSVSRALGRQFLPFAA